MLTLAALVLGFAGLFGLLACLIGFVISIVSKRGKIGWIIGLVLCLLLLAGGIFLVAVQRPDIHIPVLTAILHPDAENADVSGTGATHGRFTTSITVPAEFVDDGITQEQLDQDVKDSKLKSAKLNDDGSVTYVMTSSQHQELMAGIKEGIDSGLAGMVGSETYPNFVSVEANDDYTLYTITVNTEDLGFTEAYSVLGLFLSSGMYHAFNGTAADNVCVQFVYEATGDVIQEVNSSDMP